MANAFSQCGAAPVASGDPRPAIRAGRYLYDDVVGRDACGIGGVAAPDGRPTHEVIRLALRGLLNLEHRGGACDQCGDGAGLLCPIPQAFFHQEIQRRQLHPREFVAADDRLAIGTFFFFDADTGRQSAARAIIEELLSARGAALVGWRTVPTRPEALPAPTRPPAIAQLILNATRSPADGRFWYRAARALRQRLAAAGCAVAIVSLSATLVAYKGLFTSRQLVDFFPDLSHPDFAAPLALFHRRFSTNTYPNWALAQPFHCLGHNGEINTVRTNRNAIAAYAASLPEPTDLLTPEASDSLSLDEWIGHLMHECDQSLLRALRLSVPPVWNDGDWSPAARSVFDWSRRTKGGLASWDGPAAIVASDGQTLAVLVDRLGLRPLRWCTDRRGWFYAGSETGVFELTPTDIAASGQLQPGEMIAFDSQTGRFLDSTAVAAQVVDEIAAEGGANREVVTRSIGSDPDWGGAAGADTSLPTYWSLDQRLQAHGWDFERATFVREMAKTGREPLSSMGFDRVLTVFSAHHPTLFKYLHQTFAQVTNPPIDPYREGSALSLTTYIENCEWPSPVLNAAAAAAMGRGTSVATLDAVFEMREDADRGSALAQSLIGLCRAAEAAVRAGAAVLVVRQPLDFSDGAAPLPSLLALSAVHTHLCATGLRLRCRIVVCGADVQEAHDLCCLVGFGADAVHPSLLFQVADGTVHDNGDGPAHVSAALNDGIKKVMSKLGITTIEGYRGGRLFEAVGLGREIMSYLGDCRSRIGGIGLADLVDDVRWRLQQAARTNVLGRNRDYHAFNAKVRTALREAAATGGECAYMDKLAANMATVDPLSPEYLAFSSLVNRRTPTVLRDVLEVAPGAHSVPVAEVEPALALVRRCFRGAAMSHGALTREAHEAIAAAFNDLDACSNSGEGGERRSRNNVPRRARGVHWQRVLDERRERPVDLCLGGDLSRSRQRSRIRQVASGRFGVDAEYLINAEELQIKMAQGAKPGEGGQLMGNKVTAEIAEIRCSRPGADLISPPPHHDIYSIEDLAQLIADLRAVHRAARISVKIVAVENVGTIAVGVAKAGADVIEIDGLDGGTGAAAASSKEHCGLPSEMGLAEAHQALALNGLRRAVRLRIGGGIKNGFDVVKYALLGADEFSLGQALMVSVGCIVCKSCHIPKCPTGITGSPDIFAGSAAHCKQYLLCLAEEVRQILATLGVRRLGEITGHCEYLRPLGSVAGRAAAIDLSCLLRPEFALDRLNESGPRRIALARDLNQQILDAAQESIDRGENSQLSFPVTNSDRSVGATVAGYIAQQYGREGLPEGQCVHVRLTGDAGQSFGAWCVHGLDLELRGTAQDGVAKGMSGGMVVVAAERPTRQPPSVAGNAVGYGATGGTLFLGGSAGHRLGVRNSGATIVAEAAGKFACEYMTRGRVVILGAVQSEIGAGMTGGELIIFRPRREVRARLHAGSVTIRHAVGNEAAWLLPLLDEFFRRTGSPRAAQILEMWQRHSDHRDYCRITPLGDAVVEAQLVGAR